MNQPRDKGNFLIEVTPGVMNFLNDEFAYAEEEPVVELHYSPYWKEQTEGEGV